MKLKTGGFRAEPRPNRRASPISAKGVASTVVVAAMLSGCVTTGGSTGAGSSGAGFGNPCETANTKYLGATAGALILGVATFAITGKDAGAALAMSGVGGAIGYLIGQDVDNRRCEQWKIAQDANVTVSFEAVKVSAPSVGAEDRAATVNVGQTTTWQGESHFEPNSATLTRKAESYFRQVARTYNGRQISRNTKLTEQERRELVARTVARRILLVGHTDDTGNSVRNAELSEARARAVGEIFKQEGVSPSRLYFQGSGETYPVADNRDVDGRAKNRRVEIVDVEDEKALDQYLLERVPNTEYYRVVTPKDGGQVAKTGIPDVPDISAGGGAAGKNSSYRYVDFGGTPASKGTGVSEALIGGRVTSSGISVSSLFGVKEAVADEGVLEASCVADRPRINGSVKRLSDGKVREYATSEYMPGLYRTSYAQIVNGHLVGMTDVAVLRDGVTAVGKSPILVYENYGGAADKDRKPDHEIETAVNIYPGHNAMVYRVFTDNKNAPIRCIDVVFPNQKPFGAKFGKIYYDNNGRTYTADFQPDLTK